MAEQRQMRRHPASILHVTFEHPTSGERAEATVWDASLGGMFLETSAPVDEGALLALEITTADAKVSADARVLWKRAKSEGTNQPPGMAVRLIDLPDDVSVALNRALQSAMADKTILGIGAVSPAPTQPGIMPGAGAPSAARVPRETQIGIAPPANPPVKPRLVVSETSLPETPAAPAPAAPANPERPARDVDAPPSPARARARSTPSSEPPPPPGAGGGLFGRLVLLLVLGGAAGAVYVYRESIAEMLAGAEATPTAPPLASADRPAATLDASPSAPAEAEDAMSAVAGDAAREAVAATAEPAGPLRDTAADAAELRDAGHADGGARDAGVRDAGVRDAGRDSGVHGSARPDAGRGPKH